MRKIIAVLLLLIMTGVCYGAASDDVYVRKDVFDAKMEALFTKLHGDIQALSERIEGNFAKLSERIDGVNSSLSGRIDSLDKRMDDLRNGIYLWLVAITLVVSWPKAREILRNWIKPTSSITLEDVMRLIEENNAKLLTQLQK